MFSSQTGIQNLSFSAWMSSRTALRTDSSWWRLLAFVFLVFESSLFREFVFSFCTGICVSIFFASLSRRKASFGRFQFGASIVFKG